MQGLYTETSFLQYSITMILKYTYIPPWKTGLEELMEPSWLSRLSVSAVSRLDRVTMGDSWIASLPTAERGSNKVRLPGVSSSGEEEDHTNINTTGKG